MIDVLRNLSFYLCFSITQYGFLQQSHRDPVESLKSFVLKHFYVLLNTYSHRRILLAAGAFSPCTRHTLCLTEITELLYINQVTLCAFCCGVTISTGKTHITWNRHSGLPILVLETWIAL